MPTAELLRSRKDFFPEGISLASTFIKDLTAAKRLKYHDRKEFRDQRRMGYVFIVLTALLDTLVCTL